MKKHFSTLSDSEKIIILNFFVDAKNVFSFKFKEEAHDYFEKNYPQYYGSRETGKLSFLLTFARDISLSARILDTDDDLSTVKVLKMRYRSGDADTIYDDSSYEVEAPPIYPKGMEMNIPVNLLEDITLLR